MKKTANLDDIPEDLGEVAEIEQAFNIANKINMTPEELEIVERQAMALQDERGRIAYAEQQGLVKGKAEGRLSEAIAFVMRLLKKRFPDIPNTINSKIENLPIEDLESLGEDLLDFNSMEDLESWLNSRFPEQ